jgi:hypothetical protein
MHRTMSWLSGLAFALAAVALVECGDEPATGTGKGSTSGSTAVGSTTGGSTNAGSGGASVTSSGVGGSVASGGSNGTTVSGGAGGNTGTSTTGGVGGATGGSVGSGGVGGAGTTTSLHFAVYGDTRTDFTTHQAVVDQIAKLNPQLVLHSGDLWDGYTTDMFRSILTKNANIGALLNSGLFVAARGNHETVAAYNAFTPSLSRGITGELFSYAYGNSFFVILGMDPTLAGPFLDGELKKPQATAARWRFVQSHFPVYSGGTTHGASGIPSLERLCDQYHVAVYWSGHDHIYERSHQVFGGQVVDTSDALALSKGTVYVVSGGGGAPLYGVAPIATTHIQASTYNYVDVVADPNKVTIKTYRLDGSLLDSYAISQ